MNKSLDHECGSTCNSIAKRHFLLHHYQGKKTWLLHNFSAQTLVATSKGNTSSSYMGCSESAKNRLGKLSGVAMPKYSWDLPYAVLVNRQTINGARSCRVRFIGTIRKNKPCLILNKRHCNRFRTTQLIGQKRKGFQELSWWSECSAFVVQTSTPPSLQHSTWVTSQGP